MQQANQAYEANDLLTLLNLQIQLGQQHNLSFANQQLKAYNLLLEEQLETLQMQVDDIIYSFNWSQFFYILTVKLKCRICIENMSKTIDMFNKN